MPTASDKQIAYANKLNNQLPEAEQIERGKLLVAYSDKRDGMKRTSAIIDDLKAKVAAMAPEASTETATAPTVTAYTQAEDTRTQPTVNERTYSRREAPWYSRRNGPGADEWDNQ